MIAGILLAAGESSRMGQLKALLPWRGATLLESQLREMRAAGLEPLVVVLGHRAEELRPLVGGAQMVLNGRYLEGKSTSIVAGVAALPSDSEAVIIVAVDQPTDAGVLRALTDVRAAIGLPSVKHRRGHPTLFARSMFPELAAITEERQGLREVMIRNEAAIEYVEGDSELVRVNLNSLTDYERAYARWGR